MYCEIMTTISPATICLLIDKRKRKFFLLVTNLRLCFLNNIPTSNSRVGYSHHVIPCIPNIFHFIMELCVF